MIIIVPHVEYCAMFLFFYQILINIKLFKYTKDINDGDE